ncbi:hypothetical protein FKM82_003310 [Ascaphus truei]
MTCVCKCVRERRALLMAAAREPNSGSYTMHGKKKPHGKGLDGSTTFSIKMSDRDCRKTLNLQKDIHILYTQVC